jgi:hypothetical protein
MTVRISSRRWSGHSLEVGKKAGFSDTFLVMNAGLMVKHGAGSAPFRPD